MQYDDGLYWGMIAQQFNLHKMSQLVHLLASQWAKEQLSRVFIGYDTRFQAELHAKRCSEILAAHRIPVTLAKEATPLGAILHAATKVEKAIGLMVTGGARAVEYNGLRILPAGFKGVDLNQRDVKYRLVDFQVAESNGWIQQTSLRDDYLNYLRQTVDIERIKKGKLSIVFDSMYGSAQGLAAKLFYSDQEKFKEIHFTEHAMFGGLCPSPSRENLTDLLTAVVQQGGTSIGIAWDAEGRTWSYYNPYRNRVVCGADVRPIIDQYVKTKNREVAPEIIRMDGVVSSLLFLESLV
ncbi:hypothetical protein [Ammoniphilus resinae]|uniref:Phosphomannomutase n=1 Tax=Ammoniphilus resinae TaxID=861532 RepID=A0ABS4GJF8_9BACL|nr:hypothetical protein [Ammoniphilus resinae]MBP1930398.1 phosphomannomutase [Ammoniphilus resinae]